MQQETFGNKVKVFARSGGLTIEACMNEKQTLHTANFDLARRIDANSIDWPRKITIQLDANELVEVIQVLLGKRASLEIKFHGKEKNKSLRFVHQHTHVYIAAQEGEQHASLPLGSGDVYQAVLLLVRQLAANTPGLDVSSALSVMSRLPVPRNE